jgi:hypothetical protein
VLEEDDVELEQLDEDHACRAQRLVVDDEVVDVVGSEEDATTVKTRVAALQPDKAKQQQPMCSEKIHAVLDDNQHGILGVTRKWLIILLHAMLEKAHAECAKAVLRMEQHATSRQGGDKARVLIGGGDDESARNDVWTRRRGASGTDGRPLERRAPLHAAQLKTRKLPVKSMP